METDTIIIRAYKDFTFDKKLLPTIYKTDIEYVGIAQYFATDKIETLLEMPNASNEGFEYQIMDKKAWIACEVTKEMDELANRVRKDILSTFETKIK